MIEDDRHDDDDDDDDDDELQNVTKLDLRVKNPTTATQSAGNKAAENSPTGQNLTIHICTGNVKSTCLAFHILNIKITGSFYSFVIN